MAENHIGLLLLVVTLLVGLTFLGIALARILWVD